jgi:DNA-binding GntR family transcriptional regulator
MLGPNSSAERTAYDYLRHLIVSGAAKGGTPILQQEVADRLRISRIPVRDAIKHLSAEGLVTVESNRRVVVTNVTVADVREIFLMRAALEGLAAREAAPRLSDDALDRLGILVERMERAEAHTGDWLTLHEEFHGLVAARCDMPRVQREIERLRLSVAPYLRTFLSAHGGGELKGSKHGALLNALKRRQGRLAEGAMRDHIEHAFQEISDLIGSKFSI